MGSWILLLACSRSQQPAPAFTLLDSAATGIDFRNQLRPDSAMNMLKYMYFYNGAGIGAGDFNKDGRIDLYFAGNQVDDRLYLNRGGLRFDDVSAQSGIPRDGGWSTGVSVVDINDDGLLDIYVCRVGRFESLQSHNLLLVCTGIGKDSIPVFEDQSARYGLDFSGFSTQAAFLDYDRDGDLDMYLMNHSLRFNSTFQERGYYTNQRDSLTGDRLYRNDAGRFRDVSEAAGIQGSVIGYGLGICVSDINLDGYPDIYVANDFHENDYLYINQRDGRFRDEGTQRLMHTSQFSMGVDIADINGDAWPEIITLDMLPDDPYILRRSLGEDEYNLFQMKLRYGYQHQYTRNNLQLNRGNGMFSEIGLYAGVAATDWSWAALWTDFNNDGKRDLFISNGIPKRLNDIDYVNFISGEQMQRKIRENALGQSDFTVIEQFPQIRLPNAFFAQGSSLQFEDWRDRIRGAKETFSNGAVYADLDNDGDQDIVVNNIDDLAMVYRNDADNGRSISIRFSGPPGNRNALGARVMVYSDSLFQTYEQYPVRGFQSSMQVPLHVGLGANPPDSVLVVWPDGSYAALDNATGGRVEAVYRPGLPAFNLAARMPAAGTPAFEDITAGSGLDFRHRENEFVEFNREPLIPFMLSVEGPALAVGDIDRDGLDDVFAGGARHQPARVYRQRAEGTFEVMALPLLAADSGFEDVDAAWADINGDSFPDLVVSSGGNEFYQGDEKQRARIYINAGGKGFSQRILLPRVESTLGPLLVTDLNKDGKIDILAGGRAQPFAYGMTPRSFAWLGDGKGGFTDAPASLLPGFADAGLVRDMILADIDNDRDDDIVFALEWGGIQAYVQDNGRYTLRKLSSSRGWWNRLYATDLDGDGDQDIIAGNLGLNTRLRATRQAPVRLYLQDFDGNGTRDQVLTYYLHGQEIPFASKAELEKQMPALKKKFLYAADFAKAGMNDVFDAQALNNAQVLTADEFRHMALILNGSAAPRQLPLPDALQYSSLRALASVPLPGDNRPLLLAGGNFNGFNIQMGRQDADFMQTLRWTNGGMQAHGLPGLVVRGDVRVIRSLRVNGRQAWLLGCNDDSLRLISIPANRP